MGGMLVAPRPTLRALDDATAGSGIVGDGVIFLLIRFLATQLPLLVAEVWGGFEETGRFAIARVMALFQDAVINDLLVILAASLIVTIASGRKRRADRDVELGVACWVPYTALETLGWLLQLAAGRKLPDAVKLAMWWVALAWSLFYVILAVGVARARTPEDRKA